MTDTQNSNDITNRLRCKYPRGPIMANGEPEFGWRDFSGPAPEGMVLPSPLMLEAAGHIDAQAAEIARLRMAAQAADDALTMYERYGEICPFEGESMIHASTLIAIGDLARTALAQEQS